MLPQLGLPGKTSVANHSALPPAPRAREPGDELRCFYPSTEWAMAEGFDCKCGAPECLGFIRQFPRRLGKMLNAGESGGDKRVSFASAAVAARSKFREAAVGKKFRAHYERSIIG
jgi:hypothetical protein